MNTEITSNDSELHNVNLYKFVLTQDGEVQLLKCSLRFCTFKTLDGAKFIVLNPNTSYLVNTADIRRKITAVRKCLPENHIFC